MAARFDNNLSPDKKDPSPTMPPRQDPPTFPDKEKRDPLPPSEPDVFPEEPANPSSPSVPEF